MALRDVSAAAPSASPARADLDALAERATRGDVEATGQLLKRLAPGVIRTAQSLLGATHADVDDVVQQALIGLVQALPSFRGECSPGHFAARIATRMALLARRKAAVRSERHDDGIEVDALEGSEVPSAALDAARRRRVVRQLLAALPEEQAETLALRVVLGFSLDEVANATQVPLNTVRSRVRLAKLALRKRLEANPSLLEALEVDA